MVQQSVDAITHQRTINHDDDDQGKQRGSEGIVGCMDITVSI